MTETEILRTFGAMILVLAFVIMGMELYQGQMMVGSHILAMGLVFLVGFLLLGPILAEAVQSWWGSGWD